MKKKIIILSSLILVIGGLLLVLPQYIEKQKDIKHYAFTMNSIDGKVSLSDFKSKYPIIYYGYTYCPDICPTTLSMVSSALNKLPKKDADKFQLIFISVDPDRDKLKDLKKYARYFYPTAIGLTSSPKYIKEVTRNYGTYYAKEYLPNSKMNYSVSHTSFVYIMDKDGRLKERLPHLEDVNMVSVALEQILKEK